MQFWTSFYEQAAQIRIPTFDDYSTVNEVPSERDDTVSSQEQTTTEETPGDRTQRPQEVFETTVNSETSFMPGQGAVSSTPATARVANPQTSFASQGSEDASWTQSPLVKLSQELKTFSSQPDAQLHTFASAVDSINDESSIDSIFQQDTIVTIPSSAKGKGKDTAHPMLKNVLRHNLSSVTDSFNQLKATSPLKFKHKPKTPIIDKRLNPYLPPSGSSANWSGIVDLRDPSLLTPRRKGKGTAHTPMTGSQSKDDTDDDSFDGLPPGMSPPVLMSPVRPPRSSMELGLLKLRQTPVKAASERIQRDLIMSALKSVHKSGTKKGGHQIRKQDVVDSSMSTVPTPPSLSRYARRGDYSNASSSMTKDPSLESMIRHIRQDIQSSGASAVPHDDVPGLRLRPKVEQQLSHRGASPSSLAGLSHAVEPATPMYGDLAHHLPDNSLDSDSDSLDSINNTAHPSAAFLMASGGAPVYDDGDSFGSSDHSSDSLENEDVNALGGGMAPVHPFATNAAVVDDGFDDDDDSSDGFEDGPAGALGDGGGIISDFEEETVFGLAPAHRQSTAYDGQNIRMLGEDLLQDTIGIGAQIAASGRVEESPTPANWGR